MRPHILPIGCFHYFCDLLGGNYYMNYSLNNGLTVLMGTFTLAIWSTFAWTEKVKNRLSTLFYDFMD